MQVEGTGLNATYTQSEPFRGRRLRAGLVVHYSTTNYGNHLVNFAAKRILEKCGCEVHVIVFTGGKWQRRAETLRRLPRKLFRLIASGALRDRVAGRIRRIVSSERSNESATSAASPRAVKFRAFADEYLQPLFIDVSERHKLAESYELFAVGGDQIWNYDYGLAPWHFVDFANGRTTVCLSPSVGHPSVPAEWIPQYRKWLARFSEVGVREINWSASLGRWPSSPTFTRLIDPTLMLQPDEWEALAGPGSEARKEIVLYELGSFSAEEGRFVDAVAASHRLSIRHLSDRVGGRDWSTNAADFVGMIARASCVITDSYHGAIFAFIFDKPLVILRRSGFAGSMNTRVETLAASLHLGDRFFDVLDPKDVMHHDYTAGRRSLVQLRQDYWDYLDRHGIRELGALPRGADRQKR